MIHLEVPDLLFFTYYDTLPTQLQVYSFKFDRMIQHLVLQILTWDECHAPPLEAYVYIDNVLPGSEAHSSVEELAWR